MRVVVAIFCVLQSFLGGGCIAPSGHTGNTIPQANTVGGGEEFPEAATERWRVSAKAVPTAPPEEVFAYVSNPISEELPKGMSATADHSASSNGASNIGVGSVFQAEYNGLKITKAVISYQPPRRIAFDVVQELKGSTKQGRSVFELRRTSDGNTELTDYRSLNTDSKPHFSWLAKFSNQYLLNKDMDHMVERFGGHRVAVDD